MQRYIVPSFAAAAVIAISVAVASGSDKPASAGSLPELLCSWRAQ